MFQWLKRKKPPAKDSDTDPKRDAWPGEFPHPDGFPRPDWEGIAEWLNSEPELRERRAHATIYRWLEEIQNTIQNGMNLYESRPFYLLAPEERKQAIEIIRELHRLYDEICETLPGVVHELEDHEACCILIMDDRDSYWNYISYYFPPGTYGRSGGVNIRKGLGHIVLPVGFLRTQKLILAHELTHFLMKKHQLPLWLDEALAIRSEALGCDPEMKAFVERRPRSFRWTEEDIQLFWRGESFYMPGEMQHASYELAGRLLHYASYDYGKFLEFVEACNHEDAGEEAALEHLGASLEELASRALGPGDWAPDRQQLKEFFEKKEKDTCTETHKHEQMREDRFSLGLMDSFRIMPSSCQSRDWP